MSVETRHEPVAVPESLPLPALLGGVAIMTVALGINFYNTERSDAEVKPQELVQPEAIQETVEISREHSHQSLMIAIQKEQVQRRQIERQRQAELKLARERKRQAQIAKWDTMPLSALTPAQEVAIVTAADMAIWQPTSICEQGGNWALVGSRSSGGLGILNPIWAAYGRGDFGPAHTAAPQEQVAVGRRILEENGLNRETETPSQVGKDACWD